MTGRARFSKSGDKPPEHRERRGAGLARRDERGMALFARGATQSAALVALVLTAACDQRVSTSEAGDLVTTFDTVGGVVRVTNTGAPPRWGLTRIASIGPKTLAVGEGGPEEFGMVSTAALGPGNELYVGDRHYLEVRVFGLDGRHLRTFGRDGDGPGEFGDVTSLAWVGDRLLALDLVAGRITEFSSAGEVLGQRTAPGRWGGSEALRLYPVAFDEAYSVGASFDADGISVVYVGQTGRGETGDTLRGREDPWDGMIACEYNGGWISFFEIVYSPKLVQHPGPGAVMYKARTGTYRIAVTRGHDTLRIIDRVLPAEGVTDEEWASATERFETFLRDTPGADCEPRRPARPAAKPFVNEIFVAPDGRLWVEVIRSAGHRWEVFDPDGRLLASAPFHAWKRHSVPAFGAAHMVTIRRDSLDLDHVDVWRIERGGE